MDRRPRPSPASSSSLAPPFPLADAEASHRLDGWIFQAWVLGEDFGRPDQASGLCTPVRGGRQRPKPGYRKPMALWGTLLTDPFDGTARWESGLQPRSRTLPGNAILDHWVSTIGTGRPRKPASDKRRSVLAKGERASSVGHGVRTVRACAQGRPASRRLLTPLGECLIGPRGRQAPRQRR